MVSHMTETEVRTSTDIDRLWSAFLDAKRRNDDQQAEAIRVRMAELQEQRALQELDDDQLLATIAHAQEQADGDDVAVGDLTTSPPGPVARLTAMLDEAARRGL